MSYITRPGWPESVRVHETINVAGDVEVGEHTRIDAFVTITGNVKIGAYVHIGTGVCIFGGDGVEIGDKVGISPGVKIFTGTTNVDLPQLSNPALPDREAFTGPVKIGRSSEVGANSVIMPNVTIGEQVQVGALSFVTRDLESGYVYAGIPVRRLRPRPRLK